ncbi:hypothetical protein O4G98_09665 [Zoogloeaceae bacterium G21618-S1]|nr:hypothetical protein [Zoogloeaceae bacterium G21618-S1]
MHPFLAHLLKVVAVGMAALAAVVAIPAAALSLVFGLIVGPSKDEVTRLSAPDGKVDAVLIETNGGATTSFGYEVYLVPLGAERSGEPAAVLYGAMRNENAYGVTLFWESPTLLSVRFLTTQSKALTNPRIVIGGQSVRIALKSGENDPYAPPGGMLYNLRDGH